MRILSVNAGSTSLKIECYELHPAALAPIGRPDAPAARYENVEEALTVRVDAVAHRFVRLADDAPPVVRLDAAAVARIRGVAADAPLHDVPALAAVDAIRSAAPDVPQFAVSDSAFHRTLSPAAATYALPRALTAQGLRRRGYHGLSHQYAAHRAAVLAGRDAEAFRLVTLHLGGGSSLCAIANGASVDTTMGYTPLEGIPMATRSGSVDPGLILHLLRTGMSVDDLEDTLERRSGLFGISGRSGDVRVLAAADDDHAKLALDVLVWRTRAALGAMIAVLGAIDAIVFTGGIGENAAQLRAAIAGGAQAWGLKIDAERNARLAGEGAIADGTPGAYVVAAREGWQLARAVAPLV